MTMPPTRPEPAYEDLELRVPPEPVRPRPINVDRPAFPWLTWIVAILLVAAMAVLIANRPAPRPAQDPVPSPDPGLIGAPQRAVAHGKSTAVGVDADGSEVAGSSPASMGGAPYALDPRVGREGDIAHSGSRSPYVAIPLGPGIRIWVCGPADCIEVTSTDAGPNHDSLVAGRIIDLDIGRWERVCGMPARFGLCPGSWVRVAAAPTLPPTDVAP